MSKYTDADGLSFSLTLHSPMTKEDWAKIEDLEMESVPAVTFTTPSGKDVEFVKVVRCKYCKNCAKVDAYELWCTGRGYPGQLVSPEGFCDRGK